LRNLVELGYDDIVLYRTGKSTMDEAGLEGFPTEPDLGQALDRWQPDAAIISNPTSLHIPTALQAAEAGADLFLEKPIAHTMEGVADLQKTVEAQNLQVQVGYQFRFHPGLVKVKSLLERGEVGQPMYAHAHWGEFLPDWHPWEDYHHSYSANAELGGGVVLTLSHPLDYLRWLFGEVASVTAELGQPGSLGIEVESLADINMVHTEGVISSTHLNYLQRPARHDLEIVGSGGTIRWSALTGVVSWWKNDEEQWREQAPPAGFERNTMFLDEIEHFVTSLQTEEKPRCTLGDGVAALRICLAALQSGQRGERVLLPEKAKV
jgi:predicted dehydrogenase